jgi:N-acetyl-gamma-glutamyl-phosphate reductase
MHMQRIAIAGGSGYVGGELLRLLLRHPHVPHRRNWQLVS